MSTHNISFNLKAPITTAADDNFYLFLFFREENLTFHMNCLPKIRMSSATNFAWRLKG